MGMVVIYQDISISHTLASRHSLGHLPSYATYPTFIAIYSALGFLPYTTLLLFRQRTAWYESRSPHICGKRPTLHGMREHFYLSALLASLQGTPGPPHKTTKVCQLVY